MPAVGAVYLRGFIEIGFNVGNACQEQHGSITGIAPHRNHGDHDAGRPFLADPVGRIFDAETFKGDIDAAKVGVKQYGKDHAQRNGGHQIRQKVQQAEALAKRQIPCIQKQCNGQTNQNLRRNDHRHQQKGVGQGFIELWISQQIGIVRQANICTGIKAVPFL